MRHDGFTAFQNGKSNRRITWQSLDDDEARGEEEDGNEELRREEQPIAEGVQQLLIEHGLQLLEEEVASTVA